MTDRAQQALAYRRKKKEEETARVSSSSSSASSSSSSASSVTSASSNSKVQKALEYRRRQKENNAESAVSDITSRYKSAIDSYNGSLGEAKNITWGADLGSVVKGQRGNRLSLNQLERDIASYRKYLGDDVADTMLSDLGSVRSGYDSIASSAATYSQFASQEAYDAAMEDYRQEQERNAMTVEEVEAKVDELNGFLNNMQSKRAQQVNDAFDTPLDPNNIATVQERDDAILAVESQAMEDDKAAQLEKELEVYQNLLNTKKAEQYSAMSSEEIERAYTAAESALQELKAGHEAGTVSDRDYKAAEKTAEQLKYLRLTKREDFDEVAGQVQSAGRNWWGFKDTDYELINKDLQDEYSEERNALVDRAKAWGAIGTLHLTDAERSIYNYLYHSQGEEQAEEYLSYLKPVLNKRATEDTVKAYNAVVDQGGIKAAVANAGTVFGSLANGMGYFEDIGRAVTGQDIDINSPAHLGSNISSAVRERTGQNIENYWENKGNKVFSAVVPFLYNAGMSVADSTVRAMMTGGNSIVAGVVAGAGAATDAVIDAKKRGVSDAQALISGGLAGIAEGVFEKFSLESLMKLKRPETLRASVSNVLKQMGVEGSEEINTEIANLLIDQVVNGEKSNYMISVQGYMEQGMSEDEARKKACGDIAVQIVESGLTGALSGGMMAGGKAGADTLGYKLAYRDEAKTIQETQIEPLQLISYASSLPTGEAKALADTLAAKKKISDQELGRLSLKIKAEMAEKLNTAQNAEELDSRYRAYTRNLPENLQTFAKEEYERASRSIAALETLADEKRNAMQPVKGAYQRTAALDLQTREEVEIQEIEQSNSEGELVLKTSAGLRTLDELDMRSASTETLYREAAGYDTVTAKALVRNYKGNIGAATYARYFDTLYKTGKTGLSWEAVERSSDAIVQTLGVDAAKAAWTLGNRAARMEATAPRISGNIRSIGTGTVTDKTGRSADDMMQLIDEGIAARTGYDVVVKDQLEQSANGMLNAAVQQFFFAGDADNEIAARIHELGEFAHTHNAKGMEKVAMTVAEFVARKSGFQSYARMVQSYQEQYAEIEGNKTWQEAMVEMTNDALAGLFTTEEGAREFLAWLQKDSGMTQTEQRTVLQRLVEFFDRLIKDMVAYMKKTPLYDAARVTMQARLDEARAMRKMFFDALDVAVENAKADTERARAAGQQVQKNTADEGGVKPKYSQRYLAADTNSEILSMVNKVANGEFKANEKVYLDVVSDGIADQIYALTGIRVNGFKVAIEARQIAHILKDHGVDGATDHSMANPNDIAKMEYALTNPDDIRKAGKTQAYTYMRNDRNRTADTVLYEKNIGTKSYYVVQAVPDTKAKTLYIVTAFIGNSGYKKEASQLINAKSLDATAKTGSVNASIHSISQDDSTVKGKKLENVRESGSESQNSETQYSLRPYNQHQLDNWASSKSIVVYRDEAQLRQFVQDAIDKRNLGKKMYFGAIPEDLAQRIQQDTGLNIEGYNCTLQAQEIRKIFARHGNGETESLMGQRAITIDDFVSIPVIIQSPDEIRLSDKLYEGKPVIEFVKTINGRTTIIAHVSKKHLDLTVQTMYSGAKKGNLATAADAQAPALTSITTAGTVPNTTITQNESGVNSSISEQDAKNADFLKRNSLRMVSIPKRDYNALVARNEKLEKTVQNLIMEFRKSKKGNLRPNPNRLDIVAGRLLRESGSSMTKKVLVERLTALFDLINNSEELQSEDAMSLAMDIAAEMESVGKKVLDSYAQEMLDFIRVHKVYLDDTAVGEIKSAFDSLSNYKKLLRGAVQFTNDPNEGIELDSLLSLLGEEYPGYFGEVNPGDAPATLLEKVNGLRSMFEDSSESGYLTREERVYNQAIGILVEIGEVGAYETYADKQKDKLEKMRKEYRDEMREWKKERREEYNRRLNRVQKGITQRLAELKKQRNAEKDPERRESLQLKIDQINRRQGERVAQIRAMYDRKISEHLETEERQKAREGIRRKAERLIRLLDRPTNQNHIPTELVPDIRALINLIVQKDGVVNKEFRGKAALLMVRYQRCAAEMNTFFDDETAERLGNLTEIIGEKPFSQLNSAELRDVRAIVEHFSHLVSKQNELLADERSRNAQETAERAFGEINQIADARHFWLGKKLGRMRDGISGYLNSKMVRPEDFFREMGDTIYELYRRMQKGEGEWARDVQEAKEFYQKLREKYAVDEWRQSKEEVEFTTERGKTFTLRLGEAMDLFLAIQRPQSREHLMNGGFVKENGVKKIEEKKANGKKKKIKYEVKDNAKIQLTMKDMIDFTNKLFEGRREMKQFCLELSGYLAKEMARKGNEVSRKLYGYEKFTEENYWPITTAENYIPFKGTQQNDPQIKSKGMTKAVAPHAKPTIIIRDAVDTWSHHVNDMALYHAMVLPMEDFMRVYNYTTEYVDGEGQQSLKDIIETKLGERANKYIQQFMVDLNGGVRRAGNESRLLTNFKKTAVMANLSVIIQQPWSIIRAMAVIDPKYFAHLEGAGKALTKKGWEELKRYAPVAIIKEMGGFDTSTSSGVADWITDDDGKLKKAYDFITGRGAAKMDEITWCNIWNAVKRETADLHPELERGSEAFLNKAGERFNEVITQTQVYDSVFSKSELMRSNETHVKMLTSFMSEPTVSYNMLRHAGVRIARGERGAKKNFGRVFGAWFGSVVLNSLARALIYAMRDDDEEKNYLEKYVTYAVDGILWDWTSMTPFMRDILSIFSGYTIERTDMALINDLAEAVRKCVSDDENIGTWEKMKAVAGALANLTGMPVKNVIRDMEALWNTGAEIVATAAGEGTEITAAGLIESVRESATPWGMERTPIGEQMLMAQIAGDTEHYQRLEKYLKEKGKTDNQIDALMATALKDADERVAQAAKKRLSGDTEGYVRIVEAIKADGVSQDVAVRAVNQSANKLVSDGKTDGKTTTVTEQLHTGSDIVNNLLEGDVSGAQKVIDALMSGAKTAEEKKKVRSSVKSAITSYYKPLYKEGTIAERNEIRGQLSRLRANGARLYSGDDYIKWKE